MAKKALKKGPVVKKVTPKTQTKSKAPAAASSKAGAEKRPVAQVSVKNVQAGRHLGSSAKPQTASAKPQLVAKAPARTAALTSQVVEMKSSTEVKRSGSAVSVEQRIEASLTSVETSAQVPEQQTVAAQAMPVRTKGYRPGAFEATKTLAELSNEPINFKVGDNAVYPGHGVGRVNAIETKEIAGTKLTFYSIQIIESGMKIMVPQANVKNVGLRPIISKEEAYTVIDILRQTQVKIDNQTWNRRYREYMEKIKTGGVREIAEVLRDLFLLKVDKELSFGERKMLDTARSLLIKELILATSQEELLREEHVKAILGLEG